MDANWHPDTNVYFLECLIVSTDDTATTAATAGNGDFGTSPFFGGSQASHNLLVTILLGVSGAKAQGPDREIRRRIIYLPSGRVSPASIAKSEFRPSCLMSANGRAPAQARNIKPDGSSYRVGEPRFKAFGERPCQVPHRWVVNFIQTQVSRWVHTCFDRAVVASRPGLQSNLSAGTHLGIRNLAPKHVGRKETTWNYLKC
jgi:hypothetical protein